MRAVACPWCHGKLHPKSNLAAHLASCPNYDPRWSPKSPQTVDEILELLGSGFRLGR